MTALRIGTRTSRLAGARAGQVASALRAAGEDVEIVPVESPPETRPDGRYGPTPYVHALDAALVAGTIDVAVHSYKDLSIANPAGLVTAAVLPRGDIGDVVVSRGDWALHELPLGATVGASATRRRMQLEALGLDVRVVGLTGSVDDVEGRLAEVYDGRLDAVILGRAAVSWLGLTGEISQVLDPMVMLPAAAQGAIACQSRVDDPDVEHLLHTTLHDSRAAIEVAAERAALSAFGLCGAPLAPFSGPVPFGVLAVLADDELVVRGVSRSAQGTLVRASASGPPSDPPAVGRALTAELVRRGAHRPDLADQDPAHQDADQRDIRDQERVAAAVDEGYESWLG